MKTMSKKYLIRLYNSSPRQHLSPKFASFVKYGNNIAGSNKNVFKVCMCNFSSVPLHILWIS